MAEDALQRDAKDRLAAAREQKSIAEGDIREAYWFAAPHRNRSISSNQKRGLWRPDDAGQLATSAAIEAAGDFATEVLNAYIPENQHWAKLRPAVAVPDAHKRQIQSQADALNSSIFKDIGASNFVAACAQTFSPDLAIGTIGLWIDEPRPGEPAVVMVIPIREMELNVGPDGLIDDRFLVQWHRARDLEAVLSEEEMDALPQDVKQMRERPTSRDQAVEVVKGFWRKWGERGDTVFQHVCMVKQKLVGESTMKGEGCVPMIIGRFNPDPESAFGIGPTILSLPELRTLDTTRDLNLKHLDYAVHPPFSYPSDGTLNFDNGLAPGVGVPILPGSGDDFQSLYFEGKWDAGYLEQSDMRSMIRRLHYVDFPEQRGMTPPTATQWLDEMLQAQRRLGTPGRVFFQEFCVSAYLRFMYLKLARERVEVTLHGRVVSLTPYNPADRARDHQEVQIANALLATIFGVSPQMGQVIINLPQTFAAIKAKLGDELVQINTPDQMAAAAKLFAPMLEGGGGASGGVGGTASGASPSPTPQPAAQPGRPRAVT